MGEHDDVPTVIIEKETGGGIGSFLLGALVGAGAALLFAPRTGEETRQELEERARNLKGAAEDRVREAQRQLEERLDDARTGVRSQVDRVREAVDAGRDAAQDARTDLEHKLERSKAAYRAGVEAARTTAREEKKAESEPEGAEEADDA